MSHNKFKSSLIVLSLIFIILMMISHVSAVDENTTDLLAVTGEVMSVESNIETGELSSLAIVNNSILSAGGSEETPLCAADNVIYVGPNTGTGDGSRENPYPNIQNALYQLGSGSNEIVLLDGVYTGRSNYYLTFNDGDVTVRADEGAHPVIEFSDSSTSYNQWNVRASNITFEGITFSNMNSNRNSNGLIYLSSSSYRDLTLRNCNFTVKSSTRPLYYYNGIGLVVDNCRFMASSNTQYAMYIYGASNVNITNSYFDGFSGSSSSQGIDMEYTKNALIFNNTFSNLQSTSRAGAIYIYSFTSNGYGAKVINNTFKNVRGVYGSIYSSSKDNILENNTFINTVSTNYGGAVYVGGENNVLTNNKFINSKSSSYGGAIYCSGKNASIVKNTFINSTSDSNGGAIYVDEDDNTISNNIFINSTSKNKGGSICVLYSRVLKNLVGNKFINSTSINDGGAIYSVSNFNIINSTFINCSASNGGAVYSGSYYYTQDFNSTYLNVKFINNTASNLGGAIYSTKRIVTVNDSYFEGNDALDGGAVYLDDNTKKNVVASISNTIFFNNNASYGGALYSSKLYNSTFDNNTYLNNTAQLGGALYIQYPQSASDLSRNVTVSDSVFENNSAYMGGAIILCSSDSLIDNCTFISNNATRYGGGAVTSGGKKTNITGSRFINNTALLYGGAIGTNDTFIYNNTFIANSAFQAGAIFTINSTIKQNTFKDNNASSIGDSIVYMDTYDYNTTVYSCNCSDEGDCSYCGCSEGKCNCTDENCKCPNATMTKTVYNLLINNTIPDGSVFCYNETGVLYANYNLHGVYYLYESPDKDYGRYFYEAFCIEEYAYSPLHRYGILTDNLTFIRNSLDKSYVGDYLKVLFLLYRNETLFDISKYVNVFTDDDYHSSNDPVIQDVIRITEDPSTILINGYNYINGKSYCEYFHVFVNPTETQNLILINGCAPIELPQLTVTKKADKSIVGAGDQIKYTIVVKNTGRYNIHNVVVRDYITIQGITSYMYWQNTYNDKWQFVSSTNNELVLRLNRILTPDEEAMFDVYFRLNTVPNDQNSLINNVIATSDECNDTDSVSIPYKKPAIMIEKELIDSEVMAGDEMKFRIKVTNVGNAIAYGVIVEDYLEGDLTYLGYQVERGSWSYSPIGTNQLRFNLQSSLSTGDYASIIIRFQAPLHSITSQNYARVFLNGITSQIINDTTVKFEVKSPEIKFQKTGPECAKLGDTIAYTLSVNSYGKTSGVYIEEFIPDGLEFIRWFSPTGHTWTLNKLTDTYFRWHLQGDLGIAPAVIIALFKATKTGLIQNVAYAHGDNAHTLRDTADTTVYGPQLNLNKLTLNRTVHLNENVTFTITVSNPTEYALSNLTVVEVIHDDLEFLNFTDPSGKWIFDGHSTWTYNGTFTGTSSFNVTYKPLKVGYHENTIVASSNEIERVIAYDTVTVTDPPFVMTKTSGTPQVEVGDYVNFDIWLWYYENTGKVDGIYVVEPKIDGLELISFSPGIWQRTEYETYDLFTTPYVLSPTSKNLPLWLTYRATKAGYYTNIATVYANGYSPMNSSASVNVKDSRIDLTKKALTPIVKMGDNATFLITVTNNHNIDFGDVFVQETDFEGMKYLEYANVTGNWKCEFVNNLPCFKLIGKLSPGESASFNVTFKTEKMGHLYNTVTAGSNETSNVTAKNDTFTYLYDLEVEKLTVQKVVHINNTVEFIIVVKNTGNRPLTDVTVNEDMFNGLDYLSYVNGTRNWQFNITDGKPIFSLMGLLGVNSSASFIVRFNATQAGEFSNTVIANATDVENRQATNTTKVQKPILNVQKITINKTGEIGDNITFTITVSNDGDAVLGDVIIYESSFEGLKYLTYSNGTRNWKVSFIHNNPMFTLDGSLGVGETTSINVTFNATIMGNHTNTATVSSNETALKTCSNTTFIKYIDFDVEKICINNTVYVNNIAAFYITVENTGNVELDNLTVWEKEFEGMTYVDYQNITGKWNVSKINGKPVIRLIESLGIEKKAVVMLIFNVTSEGNITNKIIAGTNDTENKTANTTVFARNPVLTIIKTVLDSEVLINNEVRFKITVNNTGNVKLGNVVVCEDEFEGLKYLRYENLSGNWKYDVAAGRPIFRLVGDLDNASDASFIVIFNATKPGKLNNTVSVSSNETRNIMANNSTFVKNPIITVKKITLNSTVHTQDNVTFTIVVSNEGNINLTNVKVSESEFEGLQYVAYTNETGLWKVEMIDGHPIFTLKGNLKAGENASFNVVFTTFIPGNFTNTVIASSTETDIKTAQNTTKVLPNVDLSIIKNVSVSVAHIGDLITWIIEITNNGPDTAENVVVTESVPAGLVYHSITVSKGRFDNITNRWFIGSMNNKEKVKMTIITKVIMSNTTMTNFASVNSSTFDKNTTNNVANNTTKIEPVADLGVIKLICNSTSLPNGKVIWSVVVTNFGPDMAENVIVDDLLPKELIFITSKASKGSYDESNGIWNVGNLMNKESATLVLYTRINKTSGNLTNVVSVKSDTYDPDTSNNAANNTTNVIGPVDLIISKSVSNVTSHMGDIVEWTIEVTNRGPSDAINVIVYENIPNDLQYISALVSKGSFNNVTNIWTIGSLLSGESVTLTLKTLVAVSNVNLTNVVSVKSSNYDVNESNNIANNTTEVLPEADLGVIKLICNSTSLPNGKVIWSVVVTNFGPNMAENVTVDDLLPKELVFITSKPSKGSYDKSTGIWNVGNLMNKESATLVLYTRINKTSGNLTNVVSVKSDTYDPDTPNNAANNTTNVIGYVDLIISKSVSNGTANIGAVVTWTVVVKNRGSSDAINVIAYENIPNGLQYISAVASKGSFNNVTNIWTIGSLLSGESVTLTLKTLVTVSNVNLTNVVSVKSSNYDVNESDNIANNTIEILPEADLGVIKLICNSTSLPNGKAIWSVIVTNYGPDSAKNVTVKDLLPKELIFTTSKASKGSYDDVTGIWTIGDLANKQTATLVIYTKVNITSGNITNVVSVKSDTYDPNTTNNIANNTTEVTPNSDMSIVKVVSNTHVKNGDRITWTIVVVNYGTMDEENVTVMDNIPPELIFEHYEATNGVYNNSTGIWTIKTLKSHEIATLIITTKVGNVKKNITNFAVLGLSFDNDTVEVNNEVKLNIIKEVSNENPDYGDVITWKITVKNNGEGMASDVTVTDILPEGLKLLTVDGNYSDGVWSIGDMLEGEEKVLTITTLVNAISSITNVVTVNTTSDNTGNSSSNKTIYVPYCDVVISKTADGKNYLIGDTVFWTIVLTNNGPDGAKNVVATDILPDSLKYISHKSQKGTYNPNTGNWIVGDLKANETVELIIETIILSKGSITNPVNVTTSTFDTNKSNNFANATVNVTEEEKKHIPPENRTIEPENKTSQVNHQEIKTDENATGNPILLLIFVLALIGTKTLRRRK